MEQLTERTPVRPRPKERTSRNTEHAASRAKLAEPADLYRIPFWVLLKLSYTIAPIRLLLRVTTLSGTIAAHTSPLRTEARDAIDRYSGAADTRAVRLLLRRHFQYRSRARFARLWPQVRGFAGADRIEVEGLHRLDDALAEGKGAILVSAHYGYARLIKPILRSRGRRVQLTGNLRPGMPDFDPKLFGLPVFTRVGRFVHTRVLRLPLFSRFDPRFQETTAVDLPVGVNVRPYVEALQRNETLVILADGRRAQSLRRISILGVHVDLAPGAVSLGRATGAPVLPVFVFDDPQTRLGIRLVIHRPLELQASHDRSIDADANLDRFAEVFRAQVQACPEDWQWHAVRDGVLDTLLVER